MNQNYSAKVRGFWADSKKYAGFFNRLLRQQTLFATIRQKLGKICRKDYTPNVSHWC